MGTSRITADDIIDPEGHLMLTVRILIALFTAALIAGCTPFGDSGLRKTGLDRAQATAPESPVDVDQKAQLIDPSTLAIVRMYGPTIKTYADRNGFDWRLVLATMKQESRFSPTAESNRGAYGLMQLMPETSEEIARDLSIEDINHPSNNIRGGVYYMRQLYDLFKGAPEPDRIKLTLAAYNAGIGRIYDAQELAAYLHEDPYAWESIRDILPLLSRRYESLHKSVWRGEKPKAGYFGNSRETVKYVESVMAHYDEYRLMLN
jgi:soluble lytic murein transglycosylase-like protein